MNPHDLGSTLESDSASSAVRSASDDKVSVWLLSFVTGSVLWISLFLGMGFRSDFGNHLTRIYGRDLQSANMDWWLFMVILIAFSMILHVGTWVTLSGQSRNTRAGFTVLVGGIGLLVTIFSIVLYIGSDLKQPMAITLVTLVLCEYVSVRSLVLQSAERRIVDEALD